MTWEEAVRWYRAQPGNDAAVRANYFDLPVRAAVERYAAGEEFSEVARLLGPGKGRAILDLGAGNGIASFALARAHWKVTALEPDPGGEVGAGAIRALQKEFGLPVEVVAGTGGGLPFAEACFDAVFARQVLHHVPDLAHTMRELFRVLKPGGTLLALREHVVRDAAELRAFRENHPLHRHYGGENAHALAAYLDAAARAGFAVRETWGPVESILNFAPRPEAERQAQIQRITRERWCGLGRLLAWSPGFVAACVAAATARNASPGRIYSFLFRKP